MTMIAASRVTTPNDSHWYAARFLRTAAAATRAKFMQVRLPVRVFLEIFSDVLRQQNVSGIAAVHDPLCDIDAGASHIRFSGCVDDPTHGSTVYAHSQLNFRMLLESAAYFQRAFNRRFW